MPVMSRRVAGLLIAGVTCNAIAAETLPPPTSPEFCTAVQQIMSSTALTGTNTVFTDMKAYRASKPSPQPHTTYQVITYQGPLPIVVSCKIKTAAHLRAVYGEDAAGEQLFCPEITRRVQAQAVAELRAENPAAADKVAAFVVDEKEPYLTGQSYLGDFQPAYVGEDGKVHLDSPGLFQNYDHWITPILPERVQGQAYCHLPTVDLLKALGTGSLEPGIVVTTGDNATVTPQ